MAALGEVGIDISHQRAKVLSHIPLDDWDTIVTPCAEAVCLYRPSLGPLPARYTACARP